MTVKKGTVPFNGTKEQEEALKKSIAELKSEKGALMPILQKAQDIYGYLPMEVQKIISDETGIPMREDLWRGDILFSIHTESEGQIPDLCLSRNRVLCKGIRRYL